MILTLISLPVMKWSYDVILRGMFFRGFCQQIQDINNLIFSHFGIFQDLCSQVMINANFQHFIAHWKWEFDVIVGMVFQKMKLLCLHGTTTVIHTTIHSIMWYGSFWPSAVSRAMSLFLRPLVSISPTGKVNIPKCNLEDPCILDQDQFTNAISCFKPGIFFILGFVGSQSSTSSD
jgi:hypothetical protein